MAVLKPPPPPSPPPAPPPPPTPTINLGDFSKWWRMFPSYNPSATYAGDAYYAAQLGRMLKQYGYRRNYWYATDRIGLMWYEGDVVSALDELKYQKGLIVYSVVYNGSIWFFYSEANLNKFTANPNKYMPTYGGYCTSCLADGKINLPNQNSAITRHGERLYFDAAFKDASGKFLPYDVVKMNALTARASAAWVKLQPSNMVVAPQTPLSLQISAAYDAR